jgi:hypothetical protein
MTVNFALTLGHAVSRTSATITFQHAMRLQIAEERMATSLTLQLGELGELYRPSPGIMVNKGSHPKMALFQVSELL